MTARTHVVKTWPDSFQAQEEGDKSFELRFNDRGYQRGDILLQKEFIPRRGHNPEMLGSYTGRERKDVIVYVLSGFGLQPGYVALQLRPL